MATSSVTTFKTQSNIDNAGAVMTCWRYGDSGESSTCDLGDSVRSYNNMIGVRFTGLPSRVSNATLSLTFEGTAFSNLNDAIDFYAKACENITNAHHGTNLPTSYGTAKVAGSFTAGAKVSSSAKDIASVINSALVQGSSCIYIYYSPAGDGTLSDGSTESSNNRRTECSNITLTYTPAYTITYDANGGSGAPAAQTKTEGVILTLSSTKPTKASTTGYKVTFNANGGSCSTSSLTSQINYTFSEWNTAKDGSGTAYSAGGNYTDDASGTLYAIYTSSNGSINLPTATRTGYTFKGWNTSSTATSGSTGSYTPTEAITLYAVWSINTGRVFWNTRQGTVGSGYGLNPRGWVTNSSGTLIENTATYGSTITTPSASSFGGLTKTGYTLAGWKPGPWGSDDMDITEDKLWGDLMAPGTPYSASLYLANTNQNNSVNNAYNFSCYMFALWSPNTYTVTYEANGGTGVPDSGFFTYDVAQALSSTIPTRTDYKFLGWATTPTAANASYSAGQSVKNLTATNGATITLYAVWAVSAVTLTFNPDSGTGVPNSISANYGTLLNLSTYIPKKFGYRTEGWHMEFKGENAVNFGRDYMYDRFCARWEAYMYDWSEYGNTMRMISCAEVSGGGWNIESYGDNSEIRLSLYDGGADAYVYCSTGASPASIAPGWHTFEIQMSEEGAGTLVVFTIDNGKTASATEILTGTVKYNASSMLWVGAEGGDNFNSATCFIGRIRNLVIKEGTNHSFTKNEIIVPQESINLYIEWEPIGTVCVFDEKGSPQFFRPYVRVNNSWKKAVQYVYVNDSWRPTVQPKLIKPVE